MTTTDNTADRSTNKNANNGAKKEGKTDERATSAREGRREDKREAKPEARREDKRAARQESRQEPREEQEEQLALSDVLHLATGQLAELLRCEPGSVSAVKATDAGWTADVEVVEVERIPETTSVMGSYRVQLDGRGRLTGYERTRRYSRGQLDQGGKSR